MLSIDAYIQALITQAVKRLELPGGLIPGELVISLERPANSDFGDYSSNEAMNLFSQLQAAKNGGQTELPTNEAFANPRALASYIAEQITTLADYDPAQISQITVAGPGFINFTLASEYLLTVTAKMAQAEPDKLISQTGQNQPVVVEYSSPNIAKPFTVGHLRSTIIGDAIANTLVATGYQVFRDNHLGDWGTQFGKQIYAIKTWGDEAALDAAENPVEELVKLYVKFHEAAEQDPSLEDEGRAWFKKLESGDPEARRLWQKCVEWSLKEFKRIYAELGVTFTENNGTGYGESFFEDKMAAAISELESKNLLQEGEEGAKLVFFPDDEFPPLMILKKDGATLYATRDLATDKWRLEQYGQDVKVINEVGAEQAGYFKQLFRLEELLGWYKPGQRVHVKHGLYRFADKKMSTRKGNVIWLQDVLREAEERAAALAQEKQAAKGDETFTPDREQAAKIGMAALKWNDLKRSSHLDVVFNWDEIVNLKGNSGPYMQYSYVRCHSILAKAGADKAPDNDTQTNIPISIDTVSYSSNKAEMRLMRELYHFDATVQLTSKEYAPHYLCTYLYQLAQVFNAFYTECPILAEAVKPEERQVRLALVQATANVLKTGLGLLGIQTVEKM